MNRDARIELDWADGTYSFRLAWGQLIELQEKCDAGPFVVLERIHSGHWRMEDISSVVRLGLIGGGMSPADALKKVRSYVEARPPLENIILAQSILSVGLYGAPEERVGEGDGEGEASLTTSPMESSE